MRWAWFEIEEGREGERGIPIMRNRNHVTHAMKGRMNLPTRERGGGGKEG